jgi:predicted transcriptional regulator
MEIPPSNLCNAMQAATVSEPTGTRRYEFEGRQQPKLTCREVAIPEVARAILEAMSDSFSRKIITSTISEGKTIDAISSENHIPISTAYRRVNELVDQGIIIVERIVLTATGKRYSIYRSAFSEVRIDLESEDLSVRVTPNTDVADKLYRVWQSMSIPK